MSTVPAVHVLHENPDWFSPSPRPSPSRGSRCGSSCPGWRPRGATRCEFVGGEFLHAVRADTAEGGFQLCPADACALDPVTGRPVMPPGATGPQEPGEQGFSLREGFAHPVLGAHAEFLRRWDIEIAGVELIETAEGRVVTYDVNTNTNDHAGVAAPRSGPREIARFLGGLVAADRG